MRRLLERRGRTATEIPLLLLAAVLGLTAPFAFAAQGPGGTEGELRFPGQWSVPLQGPLQVAAPFNPPPRPWQAGHRGVDLQAPVGAQVLSAAPGTVVHAGMVAGRPTISILHAGGLRSTYEPVEPLVQKGQVVERAEQIGTLINVADLPAVHSGLHWGARLEKNQYIDPLRMLVGPSILKPWD